MFQRCGDQTVMTTNELKALALLNYANMLLYRGAGEDTVVACPIIGRAAWYIFEDKPKDRYGSSLFWMNDWQFHDDEEFVVEYTLQQLEKDLITLRQLMSYDARNFMFSPK